MVNTALPTPEELKAAVDEAHKLGLWVATHSYGGDGLEWAIEAVSTISSTQSLPTTQT